MARKIIAWPPVGLTAWGMHTQRTVSRSKTMGTGRALASAFQPARRVAQATVHGITNDGAGYMAKLADQLEGGVNLVRVTCLPKLWFLRRPGFQISAQRLEWEAMGRDLLWSTNATDIEWWTEDPLTATVTADGDWPAIRVTGLPANIQVIAPSERVEVTDGATTQAAEALTQSWSDGDGVALIRLDREITIEGEVTLGVAESIVFDITEMPRAVMPLSGDYNFPASFIEVLENERVGLEEVDPWR